MKKLTILHFFLFSFLIISCKNVVNGVPNPAATIKANNGPLSIKEAKQWFEVFVADQNNAVATAQANAKQKYKFKKQALWNLAKNSSYKNNKSVITVPLQYNKESFPGFKLRFGSDNQANEISTYRSLRVSSYLLVYKNGKGDFENEVVTTIPDQAYLDANDYFINPDTFTGLLYIEDWEGGFKRAYKVVNGQVTNHQVEVVEGLSTSIREKGARKRDVCAETVVPVYTMVEVGCSSSLGGGNPNAGNPGPCYDIVQTGSFTVSICGGGPTEGGNGGNETLPGWEGTGGGGGPGGPDVPPASVSDDYEYSLTESAILGLYENITDDPIQLYLIAKQQNTNNILNLSLFSIATNQFQIGPYNMIPHYGKSSQVLFYSASRLDRNVGIEYVIRADAIGKFRYNINYYVRAANLFYLNGVPSEGQIQLVAGNYFNGLLKMWSEAVSSPEYWAFAIAAFGEAVGLRPPKIADAVPKTIISDATLGRMIGALREASVKQGDFGIGSATALEADIMGAAWVGPGFRVSSSSDKPIWISADGLKQYRGPMYKKAWQGGTTQANFQRRDTPSGGWQHNGHLDITP